MDSNFINSIDIILFSSLVLAVIIVHSFSKNTNLSLSGRYRIMLAFSILAILLCDLAARFSPPLGTAGERALKYVLIFLYLLMQPLPVSLGLMYLFSLFREKRFTPFQHFLFLIPTIAGVLVMAYSHFTGYIFSLDGENRYHRGPGMFIFGIINYSYLLPAGALILYYRDTIKRRTLLTVLAFTLIPCCGSYYQLKNYGVITAWPSFALALLITYLFLESRRSDRDYLTGLFNRQSFDAKAYGRIEQCGKKGAFTLVVIDLNRFKDINDLYGHDKGDEVLQAAGRILSHSLSAADTVARYGGDEFIIILETDSKGIADSVLARIDRNVDEWNRNSGNPFSLSLSAGYVIFNPEEQGGFEELFRQADGVMFEKKKAYRCGRA